jgi:hypothetical protein
MPQPPISLVPESLDLKLYGGDGVELRLVVTNTLGEPIPLTGEVAAQIRQSRTNSAVLAEFQVTITDAPNGIAMLSLSGDQTAALHGEEDFPTERFTGVWDVQWTADSAEPITILQGSVESSLDVTRLP